MTVNRLRFKRRRKNITDYRTRLNLLRANIPRAVVRKTLQNTIVQIVNFEAIGDKVILSATAIELKKYGWSHSTKTVPAAYLTGYLAGKRAIKKGIEKAVLDIGRQVPSKGGRLFAALQGMLDAGLMIPHSEDKLPDSDRLNGKHLNKDIESDIAQIKSKLEE
ncbi:MAG: 50S ribosomal protein L18 [Thermoplasmata archaeon]